MALIFQGFFSRKFSLFLLGKLRSFNLQQCSAMICLFLLSVKVRIVDDAFNGLWKYLYHIISLYPDPQTNMLGSIFCIFLFLLYYSVIFFACADAFPFFSSISGGAPCGVCLPALHWLTTFLRMTEPIRRNRTLGREICSTYFSIFFCEISDLNLGFSSSAPEQYLIYLFVAPWFITS